MPCRSTSRGGCTLPSPPEAPPGACAHAGNQLRGGGVDEVGVEGLRLELTELDWPQFSNTDK